LRRIDTGSPVAAAAISPDGARIASGGTDKLAKLWDAGEGKLAATLEGHGDALTSVAFSPDGALLITTSADKTAKLWDAKEDKRKPAATLEGHAEAVAAAAFSPDGTRAVTASADGTARVWDTKRGKLVVALEDKASPAVKMGDTPKPPGAVASASFSPDGARV